MHISPPPTSPIEQRQLSLPPAVVKSLPHLSLPLPTSLTTVLLQEVYSIAGKNKPIKTFTSLFRSECGYTCMHLHRRLIHEYPFDRYRLPPTAAQWGITDGNRPLEHPPDPAGAAFLRVRHVIGS